MTTYASTENPLTPRSHTRAAQVRMQMHVRVSQNSRRVQAQ